MAALSHKRAAGPQLPTLSCLAKLAGLMLLRFMQLRPHDARFWCAMGQCYAHEQLNMDEAAIRCYQRAHDSDDREGAPSGFAVASCGRFMLCPALLGCLIWQGDRKRRLP